MAIATDKFYAGDSATNTVEEIVTIGHTSTGTPAAGLGAALGLAAENSNSEVVSAAQIIGYLSSVTDGAEYGEALLRIIYNGTLKTIAKFTGLSTGSVVFYDTPMVLDTTVAGTGACWFICGPAGTNRHWGRMFTGNNLTTGKRWDFYANDTAESGSNAGTDVRLGAYDDSGAWIDDPIQIVRAAGGAFITTRPFRSNSIITSRNSSTGDVIIGTASSHVLSEQYSDNTTAPTFVGIKGRGTKSSPSTVQAFDGLFFLGARNYNEATTNIAAIRLFAGETYSGAGRGTYFNVETCVNGSTTRTERIRTDFVTGHFGVKQGGSTDIAYVGGVVYVSNTTVGNVGTGEDDLMSASIAAATLGNNTECLCFEAHFTTAANANNKTVKIKFGATTIYDSTAVAADDDRLHVHGVIYRTGAATQIARVTAIGNNGGAFLNDVQFSAPTETLSGAITFKATGEATSDDDLQMTDMRVWWAPNNT